MRETTAAGARTGATIVGSIALKVAVAVAAVLLIIVLWNIGGHDASHAPLSRCRPAAAVCSP